MVTLRHMAVGVLLVATGCAPTPSHSGMAPGSRRAPRHDDSDATWQRAMALAHAARDPSTDTLARQRAELELALAFYALGLRMAAAVIIGDIAMNPRHAALLESVELAVKIVGDLPDVAEAGALLAHYPEPMLAAALAASSESVRSRAWYLRGRRLYDLERYEEAIAELERAEGRERARAQILIALCHVQLRKSVPAVAALARAKEARARDRRLHDLAVLLEARTFFSAALRVDDHRRVVVVDRDKMRHAIALWSALDRSKAFSRDARWERAWGLVAMGELRDALADLERDPAAPDAYFPEARLLHAHVLWAMGRKDSARRAYRQFLDAHLPIRRALDELSQPGGDADAALFELLVQSLERPRALPEAARPAVIHMLRSPELLRRLEYVRVIDDEQRSFGRLSARVRRSAAGQRAQRNIAAARYAAVEGTTTLVRQRLASAAGELDLLLSFADKALGLASKQP